ncbi:peptidoglycan-binding domain-containing protein [Jatrophihabitans sp.]|uniref:peptidoglycan-binding domain-containing protein n=1 Tax=Jatrophihabitans sp. TaxID=1932789 RepID=UPI002BE3F079|nr:peptidoglycan-binding domain-containing protein [Jatrophihabitans sp.]
MRRATLFRLLDKPVRKAVLLLLATTLSGGVLVAAAPASPAAIVVPSLKAPAGLLSPIEPLAPYVEQIACQPGYRAGTLALGRMLVATYPNTSFGGPRDCGADPSEHYDSRALDWMNSVRNPVQGMQAYMVVKFLLATDRWGNTFANARRMGLMYMIWNNKIWGSWSGKWEEYHGCFSTPQPAYDTACHRDHMHFSLSWNGAIGRTSFWSRHVWAATDYGPCRPSDLNWSGDYGTFRPTPCPRYRKVSAPGGSSPAMQELVKYSGATMFPGMRGGPIMAVQRAFNKPITGRYDAATVAAVNRFKAARGLPANGIIEARTWRALLAAYKPRS